MTLSELLEKIPEEMIISVGATEAYFFIGKRSLFNAEEMNKICKDRIKTLIKRNRADLRSMVNNPPHRYPDEPASEFQARETKYSKVIVQKKKTIAERQKQLKEFTSLQDREVIRAFKRIGERGVGIIISGRMHGQYWMLCDVEKEKQKGRRNNDKGEMDSGYEDHGDRQGQWLNRAGAGRHTKGDPVLSLGTAQEKEE